MAHKPRLLYPIKGITYFLSNPGLWPRVIIPFLILAAITITLLILAFAYLLPLQVDFFTRHSWPSWLAYTLSVILTLIEAALGALIAYLALMPLWEDGKTYLISLVHKRPCTYCIVALGKSFYHWM
jgi:uncharacterized protein involved in cysteine biosynthesis